jgi:hypothetical protein
LDARLAKRMLNGVDGCKSLPRARFEIMILGNMPNRIVVFAIFAAAMLFSTIREWSAPVACPRVSVARGITGITGR